VRRQGATGLALGKDGLACEVFRVLLESFGAEELGSDGVWGLERGR
jgi:hypothetical protein